MHAGPDAFLGGVQLLTAALAVVSLAIVGHRSMRSPLSIYFALFAGAMFCAALEGYYGDALGALQPLVRIGGFAGCGWAWLLARAMFRNTTPHKPAQQKPEQQKSAQLAWAQLEWAPLALVLAILAPEVAALGVEPAAAHAVWRIAENLQTLASSTVLLLVFITVARGYSPTMAASEKRFRQIFLAGYAALIGFGVLWVGGDADGSLAVQSKDIVQSICALAAMTLAAIAVRYRQDHPLALNPPAISQANARAARALRNAHQKPDPELSALAQKVEALVRTPEIFSTPNLKVSDVAAQLGEPEYKVSKCITSETAAANFNRLVNHYRIEHAKRALGDPSLQEQSILQIALGAGFGSIGPFNRAFKEATGATPRAFRKSGLDNAHRHMASPADKARLVKT